MHDSKIAIDVVFGCVRCRGNRQKRKDYEIVGSHGELAGMCDVFYKI